MLSTWIFVYVYVWFSYYFLTIFLLEFYSPRSNFEILLLYPANTLAMGLQKKK